MLWTAEESTLEIYTWAVRAMYVTKHCQATRPSGHVAAKGLLRVTPSLREKAAVGECER